MQNSLISTYSNGMRSKLSILVAFLCHAPVLIFDHPTENVDPLSRQDIYALLFYIRSFGKSIIIRTNEWDMKISKTEVKLLALLYYVLVYAFCRIQNRGPSQEKFNFNIFHILKLIYLFSTYHFSMRVCDILCNRLGIFVHGQFRCLGRLTNLKDRFHLGFSAFIYTNARPTIEFSRL